MTNSLVESLNATVKYEFSNTWGYGNMKNAKKLRGMVGDLLRNEIDISGKNN